MSIVKTPKGWRAVARVWIAGKVIERRGYAQSKAEAQLLVEQMKRDIRNGAPSDNSLKAPNASTFSDLLNIYLQKRGEMSGSHGRKIDYLRRELGAAPLNDFADRFERWLHLEGNVAHDRKGRVIRRKASPAKQNRFIEIVRAAFNIGVATGDIQTNPITKHRFPKLKELARDAGITPEQEAALLKVVDSERPHISQIVRFALRVPCRKTELVNLRVEDVDQVNGRVRIRNSQSKTRRGVDKPIPPELLPYFRSLPKDTEFVFFRRDDDGKAVPLGDFRRSWHYCLKEAKLSGLRFHDTRHISATRLVDAGTPTEAVRQIAGWSTDMLSTYYSRRSGHALEQVKWEKSGVKPEGDLKAKQG